MSYDTYNFILNLQYSFFAYLITFFLLIIFYFNVLKSNNENLIGRIRNKLDQKLDKMMYSFPLRLFIESYLNVCISSLLSLTTMDLSTFTERLSYSLSLISFSISFTTPLIFYLFLRRNKYAIRKGIITRYKTLFSHFKTK